MKKKKKKGKNKKALFFSNTFYIPPIGRTLSATVSDFSGGRARQGDYLAAGGAAALVIQQERSTVLPRLISVTHRPVGGASFTVD